MGWLFLIGLVVGVLLWLAVQLYLLKEYYLKARMTRTLPQLIKPHVRTMLDQKIKEMRALDNDSPEESCMWLNVIFARLWSELRDTEAFAKAARNLIHEELIDLKRDPVGVILGEPSEIRLTDCYLGDSAPNLDNVTVLSQKNMPGSKPGSFQSGSSGTSASGNNPLDLSLTGLSTGSSPASAHLGNTLPNATSITTTLGAGAASDMASSMASVASLSSAASPAPDASQTSPTAAKGEPPSSPELSVIFDVTYLGGISIVCEIPTTLGFFFTISAKLSDLSGRMFVQFEEKPESVFSFAFYDMPKMKTEFQVLVNGTEFGLLTRLFEKQMMAVFREKLVLPNLKTKWFMNGPEQPPYPWQLKEGEDESVLYAWKPKVGPVSPATTLQERPSTSSERSNHDSHPLTPQDSTGSEKRRSFTDALEPIDVRGELSGYSSVGESDSIHSLEANVDGLPSADSYPREPKHKKRFASIFSDHQKTKTM